MKRSRTSWAIQALLLLIAAMTEAPAKGAQPPDSAAPPAAIGFSPRTFAKQRAAEAHALTIPTPENARRWLRTLTAEPHVAGTEADHKTAVFVRDKLREWGWKADLDEMEVLLNYPVREPAIVAHCAPCDQGIGGGRGSRRDRQGFARAAAAFGAFNGYGTSGRASGQVVYANYGRPDDYTALEKNGIDVKDKIVLVRYGEIFRGLKVYNAQKRGATGILIFSDPADDGYAKGDVYPHGRFRPESAIQRGSVQFLSHGPGATRPRRSAPRICAKRLPMYPTNIPLTLNRFPAAMTTLGLYRIGEKYDRSQARRLLRDNPLVADQLRYGPGDPQSPRRSQRAPRAGKADCPCPTTSAQDRPRCTSRPSWSTSSARSGT